MTMEKSESQHQQAAPTPVRSNWDTISIGSFLAAGAASAATLVNNVRQRFHHSFVEGYGESRTPFSSVLFKYQGKQGANHSPNAPVDGLFDELAVRRNRGNISPSEFEKQKKQLTKNFHGEINQILEKDFGIHSTGLKGWTVGTWQRWNRLGKTSARDAALGIAAVSFVGLGAVAVLRHSKKTLDKVEDRLETIESRGR